MAGRDKNQVTLTFAGDSKQLDKTLAHVGKSTDRLAEKVEKSGPDFGKLGGLAGGKAAMGFGLSFSEKVGPLVAKAPISGPLATVALAAVPVIAAAVTAGLLLALGGGVLAAGIVAAAKDPKVSAAFGGLADRARKAFAGFGEPFKAPLIRAADTFGDAIERMAPAFQRMGATVAPLIDKLAPAFAQMAEKSLPGIEKAVVASVPLFEKLAEHAPAIGEAISKFFEKIAEGAPAAVGFLDKLLTIAEVALPLVGDALRLVTGYYSWALGKWGEFFSGVKSGWESVSSAVSRSKDFVVGKVESLVGALRGIPGRIKKAFSGLASILLAPFRSGFNAIARHWNGTVGQLNWSVPGWVPVFGGNHVGAPKLPVMHKGGVVPGAPGQEVMTLLQAGERVTPAGRADTVTVVVEAGSGGTSSDQALATIVTNLFRVGAIQLSVVNGRVVVGRG